MTRTRKNETKKRGQHMCSSPFPSQFYLPIYKITRHYYKDTSTLKVVVAGSENLGLFLSEGFEGDPHVCFTYIDSIVGINFKQLEVAGYMSLDELKDHVDELERFAWNDDAVKRMHSRLQDRIEDHVITMFKMRKSARKIQDRWRSCISDPSFLMCKKRLMKEYKELVEEVR